MSNLFNTRSNEFHSTALKPVKKYYAMNNILEHEPLLNETINTFIRKLDQGFADTGDVCDLDNWLHYCEGFLQEEPLLLSSLIDWRMQVHGI